MHVPQATRSALVAPSRKARALRTKTIGVPRLPLVAIEPQMDIAGADTTQGSVVEVEAGELSTLRRDAVPGAHQVDGEKTRQPLVGFGQRPVIAAVADHAHREQQLVVAERLREDVLDAGEAAVPPSAKQTAAAAPCPGPFPALLLDSAVSLDFTLLLCSALASKPLALPHASYLAERSGGGFRQADS